MPIEPWRPLNVDAGDHFLIFERRFRYVLRDPEHTIRVKWQAITLACPMCGADQGLRLAHQIGEAQVQAQCPTGHTWDEPRVDVGHFAAYCRLRCGTADPDWQWLADAGFGEEPAPPIDYVKEIGQATKYIAKYAKRKAKAKVKKTVRARIRKVKRGIKKQTMRPVAAVLRTTWTWQAGGVQPVKQPKQRAPREPKTPPLSAYRKAYGTEAPKRGPKCLVCEDSGLITAPGISIPCTECAGPVAAVLAAAERRAAKVRPGTRTYVNTGVTVHGTSTGPVQDVSSTPDDD